jgi:hypothetical protein
MSKQVAGLLTALVLGAVLGALGTYLSVVSQFELMAGLFYFRTADDARRNVSLLEEIRDHQESKAIARLEGTLTAELVSLSDYEKVIAEDQRDPAVFEGIAIAKRYADSHPGVKQAPFDAGAVSPSSDEERATVAKP